MALPHVLFVETQGQILRHLPSGTNPSEDEWQSLYVKTDASLWQRFRGGTREDLASRTLRSTHH